MREIKKRLTEVHTGLDRFRKGEVEKDSNRSRDVLPASQ